VGDVVVGMNALETWEGTSKKELLARIEEQEEIITAYAERIDQQRKLGIIPAKKEILRLETRVKELENAVAGKAAAGDYPEFALSQINQDLQNGITMREQLIALHEKKVAETEAELEKETTNKILLAIGWMYGYACRCADRGEDIRTVDFPEIVDQCIYAIWPEEGK
jgi:hypothetical protein